MARSTTRRPDEEVEDEMIDDEAEELEESQPSAPAVSDSRRRRQMKRGEVVEAASPADSGTSLGKARPTPSQRAEPTPSTNPVARVINAIREYVKETRSELSKVAWLTREDTLRLTYIVLVVTAISAIVLGLVSYIFGLLTTLLAQTDTGLLAGAITILLIIGVGGAWLLRDRLFAGHIE